MTYITDTNMDWTKSGTRLRRKSSNDVTDVTYAERDSGIRQSTQIKSCVTFPVSYRELTSMETYIEEDLPPELACLKVSVSFVRHALMFLTCRLAGQPVSFIYPSPFIRLVQFMYRLSIQKQRSASPSPTLDELTPVGVN